MARIDHQNILWPGQKATGYHLGPVAPPTADGASFEEFKECRESNVVGKRPCDLS